MGVSALRRVQVGREATKFTAVPATYRLVGYVPDLKFNPAFEMLGGFLGGFARTAAWYLTERSGTGTLKGPLLRDVEGLLPFVHGMHAYTRTGIETPFTYEFTQVFGSVPTTPTLTMEYGDNNEILQGEGGIVTGWTLTGQVGRAVSVDVDLQFSDVSTDLGSFTAITPGTPDYSNPARKPPVILTNNMRLLVGATDIGADLIGFTFKYTSGLNLIGKVDGDLAINDVAYNIPEIEATFNLETGVNQAAFLSDLVGETARLFTLQDHATTPTFSVAWTGQFAEIGSIEDADGRSNVAFTVRDVYDPVLQAEPLVVTMITDNESYA